MNFIKNGIKIILGILFFLNIGIGNIYANFQEGFIFEIDTRNISGGSTLENQFRIPTTGSGYNYSVDWGDRNIQSGITGTETKTYENPGIYTIKIVGKFPRIYFNNTGDRNKILDIKQWGNLSWTNMYRAFYGAENLNISAIDSPNLSKVASLDSMFRGAINLNSNINHWNISNIKNLQSIFQGAVSFNSPLNNWDVSNVTNMRYSFEDAKNFNQNIGNWNTQNVTNMSRMFYNAISFNQPINSWNTENVTNMSYMFFGATLFNKSINDLNVSNVSDFRYMFSNATSFNNPLDSWNTKNATNMQAMFQSATLFNQNLNSWNTENVTNMGYMFSGATSFNSPLNNWNVSNVLDFRYMFSNANSFNQNLNSWNTKNTTNMSYMFSNTNSFNQDLSNLDLSNTTNIANMFYYAKSFDQDLSKRNIGNISSASGTFTGSGISQTNYDKILNAWGQKDLKSGVSFGVHNLKYCEGEEGRKSLVAKGWKISGDTKVCYAIIENVTTSKLNGSYSTGEEILIEVNYNKIVNIDTKKGTPTLTLNNGTLEGISIPYISGNGTNKIIFKYVVGNFDNASILEYSGINALKLNGAVIQSGGINASITLPQIGTETSLSGNKNIIIDTEKPTSPIIETPSNGDYLNSDILVVNGISEIGTKVFVKVFVSDKDGKILNSVPEKKCDNIFVEIGRFECFLSDLIDNENGEYYKIELFAVDEAGNNSEISKSIFNLSRKSPEKPTISSPIDGSKISEINPEISGTGNIGAEIKLEIFKKDESGESLIKVLENFSVVDESGNWNSENNKNLEIGEYEIQVMQIDKAGNTSDLEFGNIEIISPEKNKITFPINGYETNQDKIIFKGSGETGTEVIVKTSSEKECVTIISDLKIWECEIGNLDGNESFTVEFSKDENSEILDGGNFIINSEIISNNSSNSSSNNSKSSGYLGGSGAGNSLNSGNGNLNIDEVSISLENNSSNNQGNGIYKVSENSSISGNFGDDGNPDHIGANSSYSENIIKKKINLSQEFEKKVLANGENYFVRKGFAECNLGKNILKDYENLDNSSNSFSDISNSLFKSEINSLYANGIVNGSNGKFNPENGITRAEFLKIVFRSHCISYSEKSSNSAKIFSDVAKDSWQFALISTGVDLGIISNSNNLFKPNEQITKSEAVKILFRLSFGHIDEISGNSKYSDLSEKDWAQKYAILGEKLEIFNDLENKNSIENFFPNSVITREDVSNLVVKTLGKY